MSTRTKKTSHPTATQNGSEKLLSDGPSMRILTASTRRFLSRVQRLLTTVVTAPYLERARREGYSTKEHRYGWERLRRAGGEECIIEETCEENLRKGQFDFSRQMTLKALDQFENKWFPRCRAIIQRIVPADSRDEFLAAFFRDLQQQPLGPSVVGSVSMFIIRVESLSSSSLPGAREVLSVLQERGLTPETLAKVKGAIENLETGGSAPTDTDVAFHSQSPERLLAEQCEALDELKGWFNDWATTLRPVYNKQEQLAMGLTVLRKATASGSKDEPEEVEDIGDDE